MDRQIERYKGKLYKKSKAGIAARAPAPEMQVEEVAEEPRIVRTKRFPVRTMTGEEAVDQMEFLGHDFFLFVDAATKEISLVYRRKDGNYSIIEPVMK